MKTIEYEGKKYHFKKNTINKTKLKYQNTFYYILYKILRYKKYINEFEKNVNIKSKNKLDDYAIKIIESTGTDLNINNKKIYNSKKYNKSLQKAVKKILKEEKKKKNLSNVKIIKIYKQISNQEYKELRQLALKKPNDFLKALYLYTICED